MPPSGHDALPADLTGGGLRQFPRFVVSEAGPLISLGRLDLIGVLAALFDQVHVPQALVRECLARPGNADASRIRQALHQHLLLPCPTPRQGLAGLDPGESAAIVHAQAIGAAVLMDERAGRVRAPSLGPQVMGTLGVLVHARRLDQIGHLAPLVAELRASGQRLSHAAVRHALAAVGEASP